MGDMLQQGTMTQIAHIGNQNVASSTTIDVPGSWVQLFASTSSEATLVDVSTFSGDTKVRWSIDIGIGTSGQQEVVIPRIFGSAQIPNLTNKVHLTVWPIRIPAGSTVWARSTNHETSQLCVERVSIRLHASTLACTPSFGKIDTLATSATMDITTSTWHTNIVQVSASLPHNYRAIIVNMESGSAGTLATSTGTWWCSVMLGAASSEVATVSGLRFQMDTASDMGRDDYYHFIPVSLPQGERLSLGLASTATDDDTAFNVWGLR